MLNEKHAQTQSGKSRSAGNKYDAKYFGIAAGIFSAFIFILVVLKLVTSQVDSIPYVKPFIPFFNGVTFLNVIGGVAVSFLWGWLIGYFFVIVYNWVDKKFST